MARSLAYTRLDKCYVDVSVFVLATELVLILSMGDTRLCHKRSKRTWALEYKNVCVGERLLWKEHTLPSLGRL